jgi:purine-binding chemotaxis protein CheW
LNGVRQQFRSLGALLMERGLLTQGQLESALEEQKLTGTKLGRILVGRGWVRDKDIVLVLQGMTVVVFQVGGALFGMESLQVLEIIRHLEARSVPGAQSWVEGVIDYRGKVVPVMSLARRLGKPEEAPGPATRIIVYEGRTAGTWGLQADSVLSVVHVSSGQLADAALGETCGLPPLWLSGWASLETGPVALLNIEEVLA